MAITSVIKPTNEPKLNDFSNIMKCKMHAYITYGTLSDADIPASVANLEDLVALCVPLGDLVKDPITFGWKHEAEEIHAGKKRGPLELYSAVKSLAITEEMIKLLDDPKTDDDLTVVLIPFAQPVAGAVSATNPAKAVIIRGVHLVDNGEGNGNGKYGNISLDFSGESNKIGDNLLLLTLTS